MNKSDEIAKFIERSVDLSLCLFSDLYFTKVKITGMRETPRRISYKMEFLAI